MNKNYNDPIHGHIQLDPLTVALIDTPEFQRLHCLKQLGTCDYVFRGATHTRFEHSIGVAHLAERVVQKLKENQPELSITESDIMSVKIAGLCHDLGHGPFSHVFDGVFIKQMHPDGIDGSGSKWRHEDGSIQMFRHLLKANSIILKNYALGPRDQLFIEEIIGGVCESQRKGRGKDKFYLYDIVNNTRSGLDVDKLDYFQRDSKYTNVSMDADFNRFIELGRVMPAEAIPKPGELVEDQCPLMICYPEKMYLEALNLFHVRFKMHSHVYTHRAVKQVEFMITDA